MDGWLGFIPVPSLRMIKAHVVTFLTEEGPQRLSAAADIEDSANAAQCGISVARTLVAERQELRVQRSKSQAI